MFRMIIYIYIYIIYIYNDIDIGVPNFDLQRSSKGTSFCSKLFKGFSKLLKGCDFGGFMEVAWKFFYIYIQWHRARHLRFYHFIPRNSYPGMKIMKTVME